MHADAQLVDITQVLTWPQALVAVVVILTAVVWPGVLSWLNSRATKRDMEEVKAKAEITAHEVRPNSGGSMADAVNRTEALVETMGAKLDAHITEADRRDAERDARLSALESRPRWSVLHR